MILNQRDLTSLPLSERRTFLKSIKLPSGRIQISEQFDISANQMLAAVREQGLEGVIAKRKTSVCENGKRTGSWAKPRINRGQEFVVGGFTPGVHGLDSVIVGYYQGEDLVYVARTRNGFVPATRRSVCEKLKPLAADKCPFVNLPETGRARWGEILDAEKLKKCVWVRPKLVAVIEFLEWTKETDCGIPSLSRCVRTRVLGASSKSTQGRLKRAVRKSKLHDGLHEFDIGLDVRVRSEPCFVSNQDSVSGAMIQHPKTVHVSKPRK